MKNKLIRLIMSLALLLGAGTAFSALDLVNDDTDIFMVNPAVSSERPNVLLLLDNSANWNANGTGSVTKFANEKAALRTALNNLTDQFNVGLALFMESNNENPANAENSAGYIRWGIRQMSGDVADTGTNKGKLAALIQSLTNGGNSDQSSSSFVYSLGMYETYLYYKGLTSTYGVKAAARDYTGNTNGRIASYISGFTDNPLSDSSDTSYTSPISNKCQKNFLIIISNGPDGSAANQTKGYNALTTVNPGATELSPTSAINFPTVGGGTASAVPSSGVWTDEWAWYMANNDCGPGTSTTVRPVYTYVIDVDPDTNTTARRFSALLQNTATQGKGKYIPVANDASALAAALDAVFKEVQAVNSVFASTTLPVSNNVRGTNLNQVYIGVFRPDADRAPRWPGNVKLYKFGPNLDKLYDNNATPAPAYDDATGFIFNTAKSFWTIGSTYWAFRSPNYDPTDIGRASDSPDGDLVEKGGAGQQLRLAYASDQSARNVYTCTGSCSAGSSLSATAFNTANTDILASDLNAFTTVGLSSLTSSGTTATATTSTPHGFGAVTSPYSTVAGITITGASPDNYNGTYTVTITGTNSFTYTLASAPSTNTAHVVTSSAHGLNPGDLVTVTGATPAGYNVTNAIVDSANFSTTAFNYPMSASESVSASGYTIVGKKQVQSLTGIGSTATVSLVGHGYANGNSITITGATPSQFNVTNAIISSVTADSFTYTTAGTISGSSNTAKVTATAHGFSTGDTVTIAGASPAAYNGTYSVTVVDANTFTYTTGASVSSDATGTITATKTATVTSLSNGSGGTRGTATATVSGGHGLGTSGTVTLTISGATPAAFNLSNVSATITSPTTFTYSLGCSGGGCPSNNTSATGTITYGVTKSVTSAVHVVTATGTIYSAKALGNISSVSVQTSATVTTATAGNTNAGDQTLRNNIINWVRGQDNIQDENKDNSYTDVRAFVHGDVLHSRPAVVNYNRNGDNNDVVVFYGTNDGVFHAVQGGFGTSGGTELWSFVAKEFFGKLKRLRDNSPLISGSRPRDYFFDGPIGVYTKDVNMDGKIVAADGDKVYLYLTMRRGGRMIYALDVSNPAVPKLLWKRGCPNLTNTTGCIVDGGAVSNTGGSWKELGQTWSEPRVAYIRAHANPVLIFGAGYDPMAEDFQPCLVTNMDASTNPATVTGLKGGNTTYLANGACYMTGGTSTTVNRSMGRGVFIVDAITGDLVWRVGPDAAADKQIASMSFAMPSDVSILNRDRDNSRTITVTENVPNGYIDRIYATDTGANVWRLDIDNADKTKWVVNRLANLSGSTLDQKRKFLFSPRVINDATCGNFDALVLGSGDREHPFAAGYFDTPNVAHTASDTPTYYQERFYMLKDAQTGLLNANGTSNANLVSDLSITTLTNSSLYDATSNCVQDCTGDAQTAAKAAMKAASGWYFNLLNGEKVVTSSTASSGIVEFATNQPKGSAGTDNCSSDLGVAREYRVNFCDASVPQTSWTVGVTGSLGSHRSQELGGGGFPPTPTPAVICDDAGKCQQVECFGPECHKVTDLKLGDRRRTYWYKKMD